MSTTTTHDPTPAVAGSWWTAVLGWALSVWEWFTPGMPPLAVLVALLTLVLTVLKIVQEVRAWKRSEEEKTALHKLLQRLSRFRDSGV